MSLDRLYSLKQLAEVSGYSTFTLRELVSSGELPAVRRGKRGWIRVEQGAWDAWKAKNTTAVKPTPVVIELNPPKSAPAMEGAAVDVSHLIPKGFKSPFARSA